MENIHMLEEVSSHTILPTNGHSSKPSKNILRLSQCRLMDLPHVPLPTILECLHDSEYGDGRLFTLLFHGLCVYDFLERAWYTWEGHYYVRDDVQGVYHLVSGFLSSTYIRAAAEVNLQIKAEAIKKSEDSSSDKDTDVQTKLKEDKEALLSRANSLKRISRVRNILEYAMSDRRMVVPHQRTGKEVIIAWDKNPLVLGTPDGVIDLPTGKLRDGKPSDFIRTVTATKWKGLNEPCPRWEKFLQEIFIDRPEKQRNELIRFLHKTLGYGISGLSRVHRFLALIGDEGRNGKDTLVKRLSSVLGPSMAGPVSKELFISTKFGSSPGAATPHVMSLQGKRLAWCDETDKGESFSVARVKDYTGGGQLRGRALRENEQTFDPTHLLMLLTNNAPHADATDKAFWERICPIMFNVRFVDEPDSNKPHEYKPDLELGDTLDKEDSGILAWLVRGYLLQQKEGMAIPQEVLKERANYKEDEDTTGRFIKDYCVLRPGCRVTFPDLYEAYKTWAEDGGLKNQMSKIALGRDMDKRFKKTTPQNIRTYHGVGLRSNPEYSLYVQEDDAKADAMPNDDSTPDEPPVSTSQSEEAPNEYELACDLINELELAGASIEYLPDGKRNLHAPNSTHQQKAAWKKRIVTLDIALRDIHTDMHPSNNGDSTSQEPAPADAFTEAFEAPVQPTVYATCIICGKLKDVWVPELGTHTCGTDHTPPPEPPTQPTKKQSQERAYVDVIQGHGITESGTTIDLPANCSLVDLVKCVEQIGTIERVFLCGLLPDDYEQWLLDTAIHQDYTTGERGHYFDPKDHTGHVARFKHRVTGDKLEIRSMSAWLGDSGYTVEQARDAVLLLTQYLQGVFTDDTVVYATPSQTFQQIWTQQNRLERKSYDLLPQNIRDIIHATSGQGRVELCTQEDIKKLSELHYYDGIFMYAGLTWGMPTELETHDHENAYAGKVPARYRISYTVPTDWQHVGLFMTAKGNEAWFYPGDRHQGQTFETWADGAELDVLREHYGDIETGMRAWNITILERIVFKPEKDSTAKKPLDAIIKKLVTMREQVEKDARLDTSRTALYKMVRGMVRNIVLHGIGAFHRNKRDITVILRRDEEAPDTINAAPKELGDDLYIYSIPGKVDAYSEQFDHPEYSALVWARCRARMTKWALSLPRESIIAIRTDAIATTQEVPAWKSSEKVGTLREKWTIRKQIKAPHSYEELDSLVDKHVREGR